MVPVGLNAPACCHATTCCHTAGRKGHVFGDDVELRAQRRPRPCWGGKQPRRSPLVPRRAALLGFNAIKPTKQGAILPLFRAPWRPCRLVRGCAWPARDEFTDAYPPHMGGMVHVVAGRGWAHTLSPESETSNVDNALSNTPAATHRRPPM